VNRVTRAEYIRVRVGFRFYGRVEAEFPDVK